MIFGMNAFNYGPTINFNSESVNESNFSNTENWVKTKFLNYYNNCWGPNFGGYSIKTVHAISQRAAPSNTQDSPNENTYQWDISYTYLNPDGTEGDDCKTFFYKTTGVYNYTGDKWNTSSCKHYFNLGNWGSCLATGQGFTKLGSGEVAADSWVLSKQYACPRQSTSKYHAKLHYNAKQNKWRVDKYPCDPWQNKIGESKTFDDKESAETYVNTVWRGICDKEEADKKAKEEEEKKKEEEEEGEEEGEEEEEYQQTGNGGNYSYPPQQKNTNLVPLVVGGALLLGLVVIIS